MNEFMKIAKDKSYEGSTSKQGGPFGAVIVNKKGEIIAASNNKVLLNNDPTAHAEVETIREACKKLQTYDLSDCIIYTSCYPCPMCLAAIIWANIKEVYYGCTKEDAAQIGFRDDYIYKYLETKNEKILQLQQMDRQECIKVFEKYKQEKGIIY